MSQPPPPYDQGGQGQPYNEQPAPPAPQPYDAPPSPQPHQAPQQYAQPGYAGQNYPGQPVAYQGYPQQYAPAPTRPNNTMAIVSLISGIAGLFFIPLIGSIVAVVTGHIARKQIAQTGEEGAGLATAGVVTGWVGIAVWGLLIVAWIGLMVIGLSIASMGSEF